jgi:hypothetical protein
MAASLTTAPDVTRDPRIVLKNAAAAAILAPSTHNTQPWKFRIVGETLELFADLSRHLPVIDGDRRQLVQSCGCALFNARVAIRAMGYDDEVTLMVADNVEHELLATLHLGRRILTTETDHELMHAIALRHTNRRQFQPRPVSAADGERLIAAAAHEGAWMVRLDPDEKYALAQVVDEADQQQFVNPAFRTELGHWLTAYGSRRRDGIPFVEKEYGSLIPFSIMRSLRSPHLGVRFGALEGARIDSAPFVTVIGTYSDDPTDWLASGQALESVLLHATTLGLSAAFLNQVLELPELRGRVAEIVGSGSFPHMVLRLGYPTQPVQHAAPRRALDEVLEII